MRQFRFSNHPLAAYHLTVMRNKKTNFADFRKAAKQLAIIIAVEATYDLVSANHEIDTPLEKMMAPTISEPLAIISIMRAGNVILESLVDLFPFARFGHLGLERVDNGNSTHSYYKKLPAHLDKGRVLLVDPMIATGGSMISALDELQKEGANKIQVLSFVCSPEAKARLEESHPQVEHFCACLDRELNDSNYILPGLGDAGDRVYGTLHS